MPLRNDVLGAEIMYRRSTLVKHKPIIGFSMLLMVENLNKL